MVATSYPAFQTRTHEISSSTIANHVKALNLAAFNELVLAHQDAVYRQAYWILGEPEAAEDATQEAFLRAYNNLSTFNGGPFRPWILRITTNYCLDQLRRRKVRKTEPIDAYNEYDEEIETPAWLRDPGASVEDLLEQSDERARIIHAMKQLSPEYRAAIVLVDVEDYDYTEAAASLGINLGTFKSRLSRARQQLQGLLKKSIA